MVLLVVRARSVTLAEWSVVLCVLLGQSAAAVHVLYGLAVRSVLVPAGLVVVLALVLGVALSAA